METHPDPLTTARALPKVLLHEHLDGGLRVATLLQLLHTRGLQPPAPDVNALARWFDDNAHAGSLEKYLEGFALTVAAMASPAAMRRVAFEAAEDAAADGVVLAEFRIAPLLFEAHGVSGDAAVEAQNTPPTTPETPVSSSDPAACGAPAASAERCWSEMTGGA